MRGKIKILAGEVKGMIEKPWLPLREIPEKISYDDVLLLEGVYVAEVFFENGKRLVFSSLSGGIELYYAIYKGKVVYDTDFWRLSKKIKKMTLNKSERTFFERKGYLRPGKTLFNEIHRLRLGYGLLICSNEFKIVELKRKDWNINYKKFLDTLRNSVRMHLNVVEKQKNALLFSGGKDSALLALLLNKEFGVPLKLYSAQYSNPKGFLMSEKDTQRSLYYGKLLGIEISNIQVDCNKLLFEEISYLISLMPFGAHPAIIFEFLFRMIKNDLGSAVVWTGQNADTVYGMGLTDSNLSSAIVRYFLTDSFLATLNDTKNQFLGKVIANLICEMYHFTRKKKIYRPKSSEELYYSAMNGINMMYPYKIKHQKVRKDSTSVEVVRRTIWDNYQSAHLMGMDHQVIRNVGDKNILRIFPYSTVSSMMMFRNISYNFRDLLVPKRYISIYLQKMLGKKAYKELYPTIYAVKNDDVVSNFEKKILYCTEYGKSLLSKSNIQEKQYSMQKVISRAWINEILALLRKQGVIVK